MANHLLDKQQHFNSLWLAEAVRLQEEQQGVLADSEAVRHAKAKAGDLQQRIITRAQWLANKTNLLVVQQTTITTLHWTIRLLCVLAFFMGIGLVLPTFSTQDHTINIFSALGCLLGLNLLMLVVWILGTSIGGKSVNQIAKFSLWLATKLTGKKQAAQLMPALLTLLHQKRLERWWLGRLTNGLWLLASLVATASLLILLATQRYGFIWQTTILNVDTFMAVVHWLGALPNTLGFPIPSDELIRQSGDMAVMTDTARQVWATWLVGVLVVYGILPRLILFILCSLLWRHGYQQLTLNLSLPSYALLKSRLLPDKETIGITDKVPNDWYEPVAVTSNWSEQGAVIVAIELEQDHFWPPLLPKGVTDLGVIESRAQRKELLEQLTVKPVAKLLIVCDPKRSVDRGTLNLITELAHCAATTKVSLLADLQTDPERLQDWQQALEQLQLTYNELPALLAWLGEDND